MAKGRLSKRVGGWRLAGLVALALGAGVTTGPAQAQVSSDGAAQKVARTFDVDVLRVTPGMADGREVWLVTVMNPSGDFNEAFQVSVLSVDKATGALVPSFRHGPSGYAGPDGAGPTRSDRRPDVLRPRTPR
jgi:hypothetical protein